MAEYLMKRRLKLRFPEHFANSQLSPIDVSSAGVSASPGGPASDGAIAAMASCGIDLSKHESQITTQALVEQADLILTMTNSHRHTLLGRWPHLVSKTYGLAPDHGDVSDPYGGSLEIYQKCAEKIDQFLEAWIDRLDQDTLPIWSIAGINGCT
jgi:protein-tyrosine phosphatase